MDRISMGLSLDMRNVLVAEAVAILMFFSIGIALPPFALAEEVSGADDGTMTAVSPSDALSAASDGVEASADAISSMGSESSSAAIADDGLTIESLDAEQAATIGVVLYDNTPRYSGPSASSGLIDYATAGMIVLVTPYDGNWYTGTSKYGVTYYIAANYVRLTTEPNTDDRVVLKGVVTSREALIYLAPATDTYSVRSYLQGQVLQFNKYCDGWYMGYVTDYAGQRVLGFISGDDLGLMDMSQDTTDRPVYTGTLAASPTNLYKAPSTNAAVLSTIAAGTTVKFSRFNDSWYMGTLSDGTLAYLYAADVTLAGSGGGSGSGGGQSGNITYTRYAITLAAAATAEKGYAFDIYSYDEVLEYLDPNSYSATDGEFYQFLVLSGSGNFTASQIDAFLSRHDGVLVGEGQDFVDAANEYDINVAYLVAHAVLETGWGTSALARGYEYNGQTYYNFYGYGASDGNALAGGRQWAIDKGWNSKRAAIMGAAKAISLNYVQGRGQDTVYEIRWAPAAVANGNGGYQYATSIEWPSELGKIISSIYAYCGTHDVPTFNVPVYATS